MKLDLDKIDAMFGKTDDKKKAEAKSKAAAAKKPKKAVEIQLVQDAKRQRNVGIAISRLRMSYDDLKVAVLKVDETTLDLDMIQTLMKLIPTDEESEIVSVSSSASGSV